MESSQKLTTVAVECTHCKKKILVKRNSAGKIFGACRHCHTEYRADPIRIKNVIKYRVIAKNVVIEELPDKES